MVAEAPARRPSRGEIWLVAMGAARQGEIGKHRPAVVVSIDELQTGRPYDLITVVPFTTNSRSPQGPMRPLVRAGGGLESDSVALCDAPFAAVPGRFLRYLGRLPEAEFDQVINGRALVEGWPGARIL